MNNSAKDWGMGIGIIVGIAVVIALGFGITDRVRPNSYLFVDNASDQPAIVMLDGAEAIRVEKRSVGVVYTRHGEHQIRVERGGQPVFEKQMTLESPGFFQVRKYIINPKQESGYWERKIVYGSEFQIPFVDDGTGRYAQLAKIIPLAGNAEWLPIPAERADYVLTETPPDSIEVNDSQKSVTKFHICRMDRADYEMLQAAPAKRNATEQEDAQMEALLRRLLEEASPDGGP